MLLVDVSEGILVLPLVPGGDEMDAELLFYAGVIVQGKHISFYSITWMFED